MKENKKIVCLVASLTPFLCIVTLWAVSSEIVGNEYLLPSIGQTVKEFLSLFTKGAFYVAYFRTLLRSVVAFLIAFAVAFALALVSYKSFIAQKIINPFVSVARALPTIAVVLLALVWTNSEIAPVIVTTLVVMPTAYAGILNALLSVDKEQLEACKVFGIDEKTVLKRVKIPQVAPYLLSVAGTSLSLNIKLMVAGEVIASTSRSIGNALYLSKLYEQTAQTFALVIVTVITGLLVEAFFSALSKKFGRWKDDIK